MKITVHSSKPVKPAYGPAEAPPPAAGAVVPLTVFDEVNHDEYVPGVFAFHPPAPPAAALEAGLARMLAEYRERAGRLVTLDAAAGRRAIALNDAGARHVEAAADVPLAAVMPLRVGPEAVRLHPSCEDGGGAAAGDQQEAVTVAGNFRTFFGHSSMVMGRLLPRMEGHASLQG
ncbi:hypothetical protein C2845_PM18G10990 [Panicum miliaceum]|uniref:Uncharacterized protein n=1 Tax=Panicum miliaceum TaxID=4540 RepID=A0A3L6PKR6_PANMI|nr:hypothetical protein C2845_PM18G10990 [Panicum miliaceum]